MKSQTNLQRIRVSWTRHRERQLVDRLMSELLITMLSFSMVYKLVIIYILLMHTFVNSLMI